MSKEKEQKENSFEQKQEQKETFIDLNKEYLEEEIISEVQHDKLLDKIQLEAEHELEENSSSEKEKNMPSENSFEETSENEMLETKPTENTTENMRSENEPLIVEKQKADIASILSKVKTTLNKTEENASPEKEDSLDNKNNSLSEEKEDSLESENDFLSEEKEILISSVEAESVSDKNDHNEFNSEVNEKNKNDVLEDSSEIKFTDRKRKTNPLNSYMSKNARGSGRLDSSSSTVTMEFSDAVLGFRWWRIDDNGYLHALEGEDTTWVPGINNACCHNHNIKMKHVAPTQSCGCGIVGYHDAEVAKQTESRENMVFGAVACRGKFEVSSDLFLASQAVILGVVADVNLKERLLKSQKIYGFLLLSESELLERSLLAAKPIEKEKLEGLVKYTYSDVEEKQTKNSSNLNNLLRVVLALILVFVCGFGSLYSLFVLTEKEIFDFSKLNIWYLVSFGSSFSLLTVFVSMLIFGKKEWLWSLPSSFTKAKTKFFVSSWFTLLFLFMTSQIVFVYLVMNGKI